MIVIRKRYIRLLQRDVEVIKTKSRNETKIHIVKSAMCFDGFAIRNEIMISYIIGILDKMTSFFRFDYYGLNLIMVIGKRFFLQRIGKRDRKQCK